MDRLCFPPNRPLLARFLTILYLPAHTSCCCCFCCCCCCFVVVVVVVVVVAWNNCWCESTATSPTPMGIAMAHVKDWNLCFTCFIRIRKSFFLAYPVFTLIIIKIVNRNIYCFLILFISDSCTSRVISCCMSLIQIIRYLSIKHKFYLNFLVT